MEYLYEVDGGPERKKRYGEIKREKMRDCPGEPTLFESINIEATKVSLFVLKRTVLHMISQFLNLWLYTTLRTLKHRTELNVYFEFRLEKIDEGGLRKGENKQVVLYHTKNFTTKETNKMKMQLTKWEKVLTNHVSDKGIKYKIHKELVKLNSQKTKN